MGEFKLLLLDGRGIVGSVDEAGVLSFVIAAGEGCPIRGTEMFDLMMRSFGPAVRVIAGAWRRGFEGLPSANIDEVNRLTKAGASLEESVGRVWTTQRAARWGFTRVRIVDTPEGAPGSYTKIDVLIDRPEESP